MGPKKVVLDTNIFISALGWEGNPARVFLMFLRGECELITSHQQLEELNRVLGYDKFIFVQEEKNTFLRSILRDAIIVETSGSVHVISDDPTDDVILETAVVGGAEFIVSGDKHLLELKNYQGIRIVSAVEFLDLVSRYL